jgi:hypothetical protein
MNAEVTVAACHSKMASASPAIRDLFVIFSLLKEFTLLKGIIYFLKRNEFSREINRSYMRTSDLSRHVFIT